MIPPQSRLAVESIICRLEFWLDCLEDDPTSESPVLPLAQADLQRLKAELAEMQQRAPPTKENCAIAQVALEVVGQLAVEIVKRYANGDICGIWRGGARIAA